jgi:hypothetical protein
MNYYNHLYEAFIFILDVAGQLDWYPADVYKEITDVNFFVFLEPVLFEDIQLAFIPIEF